MKSYLLLNLYTLLSVIIQIIILGKGAGSYDLLFYWLSFVTVTTAFCGLFPQMRKSPVILLKYTIIGNSACILFLFSAAFLYAKEISGLIMFYVSKRLLDNLFEYNINTENFDIQQHKKLITSLFLSVLLLVIDFYSAAVILNVSIYYYLIRAKIKKRNLYLFRIKLRYMMYLLRSSCGIVLASMTGRIYISILAHAPINLILGGSLQATNFLSLPLRILMKSTRLRFAIILFLFICTSISITVIILYYGGQIELVRNNIPLLIYSLTIVPIIVVIHLRYGYQIFRRISYKDYLVAAFIFGVVFILDNVSGWNLNYLFIVGYSLNQLYYISKISTWKI